MFAEILGLPLARKALHKKSKSHPRQRLCQKWKVGRSTTEPGAERLHARERYVVSNNHQGFALLRAVAPLLVLFSRGSHSLVLTLVTAVGGWFRSFLQNGEEQPSADCEVHARTWQASPNHLSLRLQGSLLLLVIARAKRYFAAALHIVWRCL